MNGQPKRSTTGDRHQLCTRIAVAEVIQIALKDDSRRALGPVDHRFQSRNRPAPFKEAEDLGSVDIASGRKIRGPGSAWL